MKIDMTPILNQCLTPSDENDDIVYDAIAYLRDEGMVEMADAVSRMYDLIRKEKS